MTAHATTTTTIHTELTAALERIVPKTGLTIPTGHHHAHLHMTGNDSYAGSRVAGQRDTHLMSAEHPSDASGHMRKLMISIQITPSS